MTLAVGTNTYINQPDALAYFNDRFGYESWALLTVPQQESALISATQQLDLMCAWYGEKSDPDQALAFPRTPHADPVPQAIIDAECEIAFTIASAGAPASGSTAEKGPLKRMKADVVEFEWDTENANATGGTANDVTKALLAPYGVCHYLSTPKTRIVEVGRA